MEALESEVWSLAAANRSRLLDRLMANQEADPTVEEAWTAEARRGDEQIESGTVPAIPGASAGKAASRASVNYVVGPQIESAMPRRALN